MTPCYPVDPETCDKCGSKLQVKNRKAIGNDRQFKCPKEDCEMREEEYLPLEHWYPFPKSDNGEMMGFSSF